MQVSEHVHALKIPFQVDASGGPVERFVYAYLIYGENVYLVDSGVSTAKQVILDYLGETGRQVEEISLIIQTHAHPDHIGATQWLQEESGCGVAIHPAERSWVEDVDEQYRERPVPGFHELVGGSADVTHDLRDGEVIKLEDGLSLEAFYTPGHSHGSTSFLLWEDRALFSGDVVPVPGDLPIYVDPHASTRSIERLADIRDVEILLSSWDDPRRGGQTREAFEAGHGYLQRVHEAVLKVAGEKDDLAPMELCGRVLEEVGLPPMVANPLIARSFQSSLAAKDEDF